MVRKKILMRCILCGYLGYQAEDRSDGGVVRMHHHNQRDGDEIMSWACPAGVDLDRRPAAQAVADAGLMARGKRSDARQPEIQVVEFGSPEQRLGVFVADLVVEMSRLDGGLAKLPELVEAVGASPEVTDAGTAVARELRECLDLMRSDLHQISDTFAPTPTPRRSSGRPRGFVGAGTRRGSSRR